MTPTKLPALRKRYRDTVVWDKLICGWRCKECGAWSENYAPVNHGDACSVIGLMEEIERLTKVEANRRGGRR